MSSALGPSYGDIWDDQGRPWPDNSADQPFTPLRLVVFRISDCCLTPAQTAAFRAIAELLVNHGADAVGAREYFIGRYGEPDAGDTEADGYGSSQEPGHYNHCAIYMDVWRIVHAAAAAQMAKITAAARETQSA